MSIRLDTDDVAREAALELQREGRDRPALVVSIATGETEPFVDVATIESAVEGLCDVYVLVTGDPSWAFSRELPDGLQVYGGASRVYPTDLRWRADRTRSPLRFAFGAGDRARVTDLLIDDALSAVHSRRLVSPTAPTGVARTGEVDGVVGGRALVRLDDVDGWPAVVWPELVAPGVPAERMFVKGQRLSGVHDTTANRLDVSGTRQAPGDAFRDVAPGDGLLARVSSVSRTHAGLELVPGTALDVDAALFGADAEVDLRELVSTGEVLPVEVVEVRDGVPTKVEPLAPELADMTKPVAVFAGGPAWLVPSQVHAVEAEVDLQPERPLPGTEASTPESAERDALLLQIADLEREAARLRNELVQARTSARTARQRAKQAQKEQAQPPDSVRIHDVFADPFEQFRHEVYVTWAARTTPDDKAEHPWREFSVSPGFFETLESVAGIDRSKVVEVAADVVCGRAEAVPGRALHQLRAGPGANDAPIVRAGGGTCWRLSLQTSSPSARRLHFWRMPDRSVELASVRLHDDFTP